MCLSIPAKISHINEKKAQVTIGEIGYNIDISLIDNVQIGDYVMVHSGYAIEKLDQQAAEETLDIFKNILIEGETL